MNKSMQGKICLVTGATSGIGFVTARELARKGAQVVIVGRNAERCITTVGHIQRETDNQQVSHLVADLSSQRQIRQLAEGYQYRYGRLDVLVNNAGAFILRRRESEDGFEMTFALNHLGYFLLTNLLLDVITAGGSARIVNVASNAHFMGRINFENLQSRGFYNGWASYAQSKLANILFTYELSRRLAGTQVTVNTLHPGLVATNFARNNGWFVRMMMPFVNLLAINVEEGAQTSIYLASSPEVEGVTGQYFVKQKPARSSPASYDRETARRLWKVSAEMVSLDVKA